MATLHMTEAELVKNIEAVMEQVRQGNEVVIKDDNREVAVLKPARPKAGKLTSEIIADMQAFGSDVKMDPDFARDIEEGIKAMRQPWNPPPWD